MNLKIVSFRKTDFRQNKIISPTYEFQLKKTVFVQECTDERAINYNPLIPNNRNATQF
jgi:hypothetical protein